MRSNAVLAIDDFQEDSPIEVKDSGGFKGVFANGDITQSAIIFCLKGTISKRASKYTIQIGSKRHLNVPTIRKTNDDLNYCWQYLNHSCAPNGYIDTAALTFRALRDIKRGEEITFHYLTTESEMAVPFPCICGAPECFGFIQGRNFLSPAESERLALIVGEDNLVALFMPAPKLFHL
ncbi:MAG TPA: SET domain-containing protein-lysine N-methyltransferase [Pyrinomonadaceae bacterium]|jgi:hypothetical protein|nr:SET domain-containing protein-lysine N-methyltransferase [Pyrinomonadaceae bacterium]